MPNRIDPLPDPYSRKANDNVRQPARMGTSATMGSTRPQQRMRAVCTRTTDTKTIITATLTAIDFDAEEFDNSGLHDTVTNNSRLTIPSTGLFTGTWLLHGHCLWFPSGVGDRALGITKNGAIAANLIASALTPGFATYGISQDVWRYVDDPHAGDYFELVVVQTSGGNLNLDTSPKDTYFEIIHSW